MNFFDEMMVRVSDRMSVFIDLENKTLKFGKEKVVENGELTEKYKDYDYMPQFYSCDNPWETIENLYESYRFSTPGKRDIDFYRKDSVRKTYFKALPLDELDDATLVVGEEREIAKVELEGFVLLMTLENKLKWIWEDKWFWQSEKYPDLIVLKKWIVKEN